MDRFKIAAFIAASTSALALGFEVAASVGGSWGTSQLPLMGQWQPVTIKFGLTCAEGDYGSVTGGVFAVYDDILSNLLDNNATDEDLADLHRLNKGTRVVTGSLVFSVLLLGILVIWSLSIWPIGPFQRCTKFYRYGFVPALLGPIACGIAAAAWWFMCARSLNTDTWSEDILPGNGHVSPGWCFAVHIVALLLSTGAAVAFHTASSGVKQLPFSLTSPHDSIYDTVIDSSSLLPEPYQHDDDDSLSSSSRGGGAPLSGLPMLSQQPTGQHVGAGVSRAAIPVRLTQSPPFAGHYGYASPSVSPGAALMKRNIASYTDHDDDNDDEKNGGSDDDDDNDSKEGRPATAGAPRGAAVPLRSTHRSSRRHRRDSNSSRSSLRSSGSGSMGSPSTSVSSTSGAGQLTHSIGHSSSRTTSTTSTRSTTIITTIPAATTAVHDRGSINQ